MAAATPIIPATTSTAGAPARCSWERAALPSDIFFDPVTTYSHAIDGVDYAPSSAHTYDNNVFLPLADRFLTFGGASYDDGRPYLRPSETDPTQMRLTGPYLFDPSRANGNKVGGSTGSHVQRVAPHPEIVGGYMWENRDIAKHLAGDPMPTQYVSGCAQPTVENGHDVVYVAGGISLELYRYQLTDLADPSQDAISKVGAYWQGTSGITTCALDPTRKLFVRTGTNAQPFQFWDLTSPGASNPEQFIACRCDDGELPGMVERAVVRPSELRDEVRSGAPRLSHLVRRPRHVGAPCAGRRQWRERLDDRATRDAGDAGATDVDPDDLDPRQVALCAVLRRVRCARGYRRRQRLDLQARRLGTTESAGQCTADGPRAVAGGGRFVRAAGASESQRERRRRRWQHRARRVLHRRRQDRPIVRRTLHRVSSIRFWSERIRSIAIAVDNVGGMAKSRRRHVHRQCHALHVGPATRPERLYRRQRHVPRRLPADDGARRERSALSRRRALYAARALRDLPVRRRPGA